MDIQGGIIRVLEYRIVKVPCSGDSEVGDSVVLVVEEFEHVGSDGSSVFGDPRYVPINPGVRVALQRPAPPSPSKKEGYKSQEYSFTQSLDPTDLLFLESTCTQTFQRQYTTFPRVISDSDWKIPGEQIKILEGIRLLQIETFEYEAGSDVELSEDENEKAKRLKITFPLTQTSQVSSQGSQNSQSQVPETLTVHSQYPVTQLAQSQYPTSQMPLTQAPLTQAPMTQAPLSQISSQLVSSQTQTLSPVLTGPAIFPETQLPSSNSANLGVTQSSPVRISRDMLNNRMTSPIKSNLVRDVMSSPINSGPINTNNVTPFKNNAIPVKFSSVNRENVSPFVSEVIKTSIEAAEVPSSPINSPVKKSTIPVTEVQKLSEPVIEYPDYSSW